MSDFEDGDIVRVTCLLRAASGDDIQNVYHYKIAAPAPVSESVVTGQIRTQMNAMYSDIQPEIPADVSFVSIDIANLTKGEVFPAYSWPTLTAGGGTGDTMPEQVTALVVGRTNQSHVVGRKFLGPFIEASNDDGTWRSTLLTMLGSFAGKYITSLVFGGGATAAPGVVRWVGGVIDRFTPVFTAVTNNQIYTQRRRRRGHGA